MDSLGNFAIGGYSSEPGLVSTSAVLPKPIVTLLNTTGGFQWGFTITTTLYDLSSATSVKFNIAERRIMVGFDDAAIAASHPCIVI